MLSSKSYFVLMLSHSFIVYFLVFLCLYKSEGLRRHLVLIITKIGLICEVLHLLSKQFLFAYVMVHGCALSNFAVFCFLVLMNREYILNNKRENQIYRAVIRWWIWVNQKWIYVRTFMLMKKTTIKNTSTSKKENKNHVTVNDVSHHSNWGRYWIVIWKKHFSHIHLWYWLSGALSHSNKMQ